MKDKLFFFLDAEHTNQNLGSPVAISAPFSQLSGDAASPFRETDLDGRLDWQFWKNARMFYRFTYFDSRVVASGGGVGFSPFQDKNYTRSHVVGADFTTKGGYTHSFRFEYLKFINNLGDSVVGSSLPLADLPVSINILSFSLLTGPNLLAPQQTYQTDRQIKYDGSKLWGSHILRYGVAYNLLRGGGFASFFSISPVVSPNGTSNEVAAAASGPFTCGTGIGGSACPLNYPVDAATIGNGLGCGSEIPAFGEPCGGTPTDNRLGLYVGDSWKVKPNFTLTYGVRYSRDTGRTNSDLPALPAVNAVLPGLGNRVNQPNHNFGPQLGFAWDPRKDSKTVIRAGIGVFYENAIWNDAEFDRPERLASGSFFNAVPACASATGQGVPFPDGSTQYLGGSQAAANYVCGTVPNPNPMNIPQALIGSTLGPTAGTCSGMTTAQCVGSLQTAWKQASAGTSAINPLYLPNLIANNQAILLGALAPNYRTPYSVQINAGIQRELMPGMVLSVDYLRNVNLHYLLGVDANHSGDTRYFNSTFAQQAISTTNGQFGCPGSTSAAINCAIAAGATMTSYANNGLDSAADLGVGGCLGALGFNCAFTGVNPAIGPAVFLFPIGRSVYNALDVKLVDNVKNPFRGVKYLNFQFAYSLSRFTNTGSATSTGPSGGDQDFVNAALDNRNPLRFSGPSALDRTHQFSFGGYADLPGRFRLGTIFHFDSPLASLLTVPNTGLGAGEIFRTDFTGDGTVQDPLPGTKVGSFMRGISPGDLATVVNNYNTNIANTPTLAGQVLIANGLFTETQLQELGAVAPVITYTDANGNTIPGVIPGEVGLTWLKTLDMSLAWIGKVNVKEREITIQPSASVFNLFNFANFNIPGNTLSGILNGGAGSANGTTYANATALRIGVGTGVFSLGAPRTIEFGLKMTF